MPSSAPHGDGRRAHRIGRRRPGHWFWGVAGGLIALTIWGGLWEAGAFAAAHPMSDGVQLVRPQFAREPAPPPAPPLPVTGHGRLAALARAANNAARELAGSGDNSLVSWNPQAGLWARMYLPAGVSSNWRAPVWWQSAIALDVLVRYLTATHDTQPQFEALIERTYQMGIRMPGTDSPRNFANQFMDDTAWWALAWLDTARYELTVRHDVALARRYEHLAVTDAAYIYSRPRPCRTRGIEWQVDYPPDTITNAEFVALAAELARTEDAPGPLADPAQGHLWLARAQAILGWLESSGLVDVSAGTVSDHYNGRCQPTGGPLTYTEGEMADALTQLGLATGNPAYFSQASGFIDWVLSPPSGMTDAGVLQEPCEARAGMCGQLAHAYDASAYKGLFVQAVADWTQATGSGAYRAFLLAQGRAVLANASSDGTARTPCGRSAHDCQLGFYWARRVAPSRWPVVATPGTQESGLTALTAALRAAQSPASTATAGRPAPVPASARRRTPGRRRPAARSPAG